VVNELRGGRAGPEFICFVIMFDQGLGLFPFTMFLFHELGQVGRPLSKGHTLDTASFIIAGTLMHWRRLLVSSESFATKGS